jgi:hypothetical protein
MLVIFISSPQRHGGPSVQPGSRNRSNADIGSAPWNLEHYRNAASPRLVPATYLGLPKRVTSARQKKCLNRIDFRILRRHCVMV